MRPDNGLLRTALHAAAQAGRWKDTMKSPDECFKKMAERHSKWMARIGIIG
jgi:hypothetical protein